MWILFFVLESDLVDAASSGSERKKDHLANPLLRVARFRNQFKFVYASANAHSQLMRINQAGEWTIAPLSFGRNSQQIFVARKQNPAQLSGTVQQRRVV